MYLSHFKVSSVRHYYCSVRSTLNRGTTVRGCLLATPYKQRRNSSRAVSTTSTSSASAAGLITKTPLFPLSRRRLSLAVAVSENGRVRFVLRLFRRNALKLRRICQCFPTKMYENTSKAVLGFWQTYPPHFARRLLLIKLRAPNC